MTAPAGPVRPRPRPKVKPRTQYGALPYRQGEDVEILLITSRETGRWVIPKGWPMGGRSAAAAAAREAREEAGVVGEIASSPTGAYVYVKFGKTGRGALCKVKVFPLKVTAQLEDWPEKGQRSSRWSPWRDAAAAVHERQLARLIRKFGKKTARAAARPAKDPMPPPKEGEPAP